ncbi:MAG: hypothetical protein ACOYM3_31875 [Terrimicrobiaceae bacterium]
MKKRDQSTSQPEILLIPGGTVTSGENPQPAKSSTSPSGEISKRREHSGAPTLGIDYGVEFSEQGSSDAQGYLEVSVSIVPIGQFDYEAVYRDLDGANGEEAKGEIIRLAADALGEMLEWVQEDFESPDSGVKWNPETSLRSKLALIRLYRSPASLGNATLTQLADRLDVSKQKLSLLWAEFKRRFPGVRAPWEKSEIAKEAYKKAHRKAA